MSSWHWHDTGADTDDRFESVCTIAEGAETAVYVVVKRQINGATKRYIERFTSRVTGSTYLDCSSTWAGGTTPSQLWYLEGRSVYAVADGRVLGPYTVTNGQIDFSDEMPDGATNVVVGIRYDSDLETLNLKLPQANVRSNVKSVNRVSFEVIASRGMRVGPSFDKLIEWKQRRVADNYDPVALFTGLDHTRFKTHYEHDARICLRQADPLPCTLVALSREVDIGGG